MDWLEMWQGQLRGIRRHDPIRNDANWVMSPDPFCCPVCQISLEERIFGEKTDVYVDRCTAVPADVARSGELVIVKRISVEQDVWRHAD